MGEAEIHRNTSFAKLFYISCSPGPTNLEPSPSFSQLWPHLVATPLRKVDPPSLLFLGDKMD